MNASRYLQYVLVLFAVSSAQFGVPISAGEAPGQCAIAEVSGLNPVVVPGVQLDLPVEAKGPYYDSDDINRSRPTWSGTNWSVHFVYGNGGLTEFMENPESCTINDGKVYRRVKIGTYMRYGAVADIWHADSPSKVTSIQVSIRDKGLTEEQALAIIASAVTTWENP